jgi:hypothetical protein
MNFDFANPATNGDVLQDFDFDSFLHNEDADNFNFDTSGFLEADIGAE